MTTIAGVLHAKGGDTWSIKPDASVYDAIAMMADKGVGALLVIEDGRLVGIVSERDYARKVILKGRSAEDTPVSDIMTPNVFYARPQQSVEEGLTLMTAKRIRHLPVMDEGQLVGIVSIGDLVKSIISQQEHLIHQLETYITGGRA